MTTTRSVRSRRGAPAPGESRRSASSGTAPPFDRRIGAPIASGAIRELLGLFEAAVEQRAHRLPQRVVPEVDRVAQLLGEAGVVGDLGVGRFDLAQLEQVDDPVEPSLQHELCVPGALGQPHDLLAGGQPVLDRLAIPEGGAPGVHACRRAWPCPPAGEPCPRPGRRATPAAPRDSDQYSACASRPITLARSGLSCVAEHASASSSRPTRIGVDLAEADAAGAPPRNRAPPGRARRVSRRFLRCRRPL